MSTQKGNSNRSRSQRYQNQTAFKNDLHDKSHIIKKINNIEIANVCERCKKIIEWKIKYKKYKLLKAPAKCIKCEQKSVKYSYHKMCLHCSKEFKVCPKCCENSDIVEGKPSKEESVKLDADLQVLLKELPERKRRTFIRYLNQNVKKKKKTKLCNNGMENGNKVNDDKNEQYQTDSDSNSLSRDTLLLKLQSLVIKEEGMNDHDDSDSDSDDSDFFM